MLNILPADNLMDADGNTSDSENCEKIAENDFFTGENPDFLASVGTPCWNFANKSRFLNSGGNTIVNLNSCYYFIEVNCKSNFSIKFDASDFRVNRVNISIKRRKSDEELLRNNQKWLKESGFYWGNISSETAIKILEGSKIGSFILRDSKDFRFLYALSIKTSKGVTSVRIKYQDRQWSLDGNEKLPKFESILHMIEYYINGNGKKIFWLENSGRFFTPIYLESPKKNEISSLKHLTRVALNKMEERGQQKLPASMQIYLEEYPFKI